MKRAVHAVVLLSALAAGCHLVGCSGAGTPAAPGDLAALRMLAADHVSAVLLLSQWLPLLYPPPEPPGRCSPSFVILPPQPGDPSGSMRFYITLSDCTEVSGFQLADHSGHERVLRPDGLKRRMTWSAPRLVDAWKTQDVTQTFWDGTRMEYENGYDTTSPVYDHYYRGSLTRSDGQAMDFSHDRNLNRDRLTLALVDRSELTLEVPLHSTPAEVYWPAFTRPAQGAYAGSRSGGFSLNMRGQRGAGWKRLATATPDGISGDFALGPDLSGAGRFRRGSEVLAAFRWDATGAGRLDPILGPSSPASPSSAARDLAIDRWIQHLADLGPFPSR